MVVNNDDTGEIHLPFAVKCEIRNDSRAALTTIRQIF